MTIQMLSIIGAVVGVVLGTIAPAIMEGRAVTAAMEGIARQPEAAGRVTGLMWIGFALTESLALIGIAVPFFIK